MARMCAVELNLVLADTAEADRFAGDGYAIRGWFCASCSRLL